VWMNAKWRKPKNPSTGAAPMVTLSGKMHS
jgi:hypothetical protein